MKKTFFFSRIVRRTLSNTKGRTVPRLCGNDITDETFNSNQVPPAELEDVLLSHDLVTEAGVCAKWDDAQGTEVPVGYVSLNPKVAARDRDSVIAEIKVYHDERVASYKKLRGGLFYLPVLPRNPTGKLLRRSLPARKEATAAVTQATAKRETKL